MHFWKNHCWTVFFHPVSLGSLPCFWCVPDSNDQLVIKFCWGLITSIHLNQMCWSRDTSTTYRLSSVKLLMHYFSLQLGFTVFITREMNINDSNEDECFLIVGFVKISLVLFKCQSEKHSSWKIIEPSFMILSTLAFPTVTNQNVCCEKGFVLDASFNLLFNKKFLYGLLKEEAWTCLIRTEDWLAHDFYKSNLKKWDQALLLNMSHVIFS